MLSLRAPGLGFIMITLALGQIVWGVAYRANDLTGGDNGIRHPARPMPFGFDIRDAPSFYYFTLIVFAIALFFIWRFSRSPFGASLMGTRDQPRRMRMLGHNVWLIQLLTFVMAGFWGSVASILYVYYNLFLSPHAISLQQSAEILLMAILGGASTLTGPIVGAAIITLVKNVVSTYVERWNTLLGADLRGGDHVHAVRPGAGLHAAVAAAAAAPKSRKPADRALRRSRRRMTRARRSKSRSLNKRFGGLPATKDVSLTRHAGRAPADHRPERRRQDHAVQPDHRRSHRRQRLGPAVRTGAARHADAEARASRARPHLPDPHAVPARAARSTTWCCRCSASTGGAGIRWSVLTGQPRPLQQRARSARAQVGLGDSAERIVVETSYGERRRLELAMALAQKPKLLLLDEPLAGLSQGERQTVRALLDTIPRDVTIVMIEHDMDTALGFAERITVLHYGEVIVEGTRAEVVADPRTREVYLGD